MYLIIHHVHALFGSLSRLSSLICMTESTQRLSCLAQAQKAIKETNAASRSPSSLRHKSCTHNSNLKHQGNLASSIIELHPNLLLHKEMKRAPPSYHAHTNTRRNASINMNNNSNDDINEACSSLLLESPPYRNKEPLPMHRQYGQTYNDRYQKQQQQQQQQTKLSPSSAPVMCTLISPPTPFKHANTTAAPPPPPTTYYNGQQKKMSVSFAPTAKVQPINIPKASDMTHQEKQTIWYLENDYNRFKHDAASDGGVKIIRNVSVEAQQMKKSCHFVLVGSFDGKCDEDTTSSSSNNGSNHSSDVATAGSNRSSPSGKFYNEHEYNDYMKENGQEVCKRGLGYHFSRIRRRNRVMTRSAVVAWQKSMQKESNKQSIEKLVLQEKLKTMSHSSSDTEPLPKAQKTQSILLALVSSKCSKVSREEALWRGNIDFRVAYPGVSGVIQRKRSSGSRADDDGSMYHASKRRRSNVCAFASEADGNNTMKVSAARYAEV